MSIFKRSFRSKKQKSPISQYLADQGPTEEKKKVIVHSQSDAGKVRRKSVEQIAGGEGEKKQWWKSITFSDRIKAVTEIEDDIPPDE